MQKKHAMKKTNPIFTKNFKFKTVLFWIFPEEIRSGCARIELSLDNVAVACDMPESSSIQMSE